MIRCTARIAAPVAVFAWGALVASAQLTFEVSNQGGATPQMLAGFSEAAAIWSARLSDPITLNVRVNAAALGAGVTGSTSSFFDTYSYSATRAALVARRQSADDLSAAAALPAGSIFPLLINRTANSPSGTVSSTPYFDTGLGGPGQAGPENNSTVRMTTANAKALRLGAGNGALLDGTITFGTQVPFDYDRNDGIAAGQIDFVGIAAHEIGHLLGFSSGVDVLVGNGAGPGLNDNQLADVTPLDLFRFSSRSTGPGGGVIDWTADNTARYFSVDGGTTPLGAFSNGASFGDGFQASHWKDNLGIGLMDPTAGAGEMLALTATDLRAFDVIGYTLTPAPEPSSLCLVLAGSLAVFPPGRRGRQRST